MLDIESTQTKSTNYKKVIAGTAAATLCVGAAVFATTSGVSTSAQTALISIPDTFSGSYSAVYDNGDEGFSGVFNKDVDANGDWTLEGHIVSDDKLSRWTLKDNKVYQNNTCYVGQRFPVFGQIPAALDMAVALDEVHPDQKARVETHCPSGATALEFMGLEYAVCAESSKNGAVIKALGSDFVLSATMNEQASKHVIMAPDGHKEMKCAKKDLKKTWEELNGVERFSEETRRLWGKSSFSKVFSVARSRYTPQSKGGSDNDGRSDNEPKPIPGAGGGAQINPNPWATVNPNANYNCYFFHGVGNEPFDVATPTSHLGPYAGSHPTYSDGSSFSYWGDLHIHTKCKKHVFMNIDTRTHGYSSTYIQQEFCDMLLANGALDKGGNTKFGHTVVTHSMGGMTSSEAFNNGLCGVGSAARYVTVQAPWRGSSGADMVETICKIKGLSQAALAINGYCKPCNTPLWNPTCPGARPAYLTLAYAGLANGNLTFPNRTPNAQMCGTDPLGLMSGRVINAVTANPSLLATNPALVAIAGARSNQKLGECSVTWRRRNNWRNDCRSSSACQGNTSCYNKLISLDQWNDGMVDMHSCTNTDIHDEVTSGSDGGENKTDNFAISHADGTCMNGDGIYGSAQPCTWIKNKIANPTFFRFKFG
jgi:hypothetical protein